MSRSPAYLPLFGNDYLADTTHLSTEEHGAYLLLMMAAWRQDDCALPIDDRKLARITGLSLRRWLGIKDTILAFWTVEDDRIFQPRLRRERSYADQKSASNRENANKRWEKQPIEKNGSASCDRISERNAPKPQPQKIEIEAKASRASGDALKSRHVMEEWNSRATKLGKPTVRDLTPSRDQLVRARIGQYSLEDFVDVFGKIERSNFLREGRFCTFDWTMKRQNFQKILEGNYDQ